MTDYHHGDLRRALLDEAEIMAEASGVETITLRALARQIGVSHSAPVHHFATRQGLLTALALRGFEQLLEAVSEHAADIYDMGVAYVAWAIEHPGLYTVMWQPRLLDNTNAQLRAARQLTWDALFDALASRSSQADEAAIRIDAYAAFSIVHGLSGLWIQQALSIPTHPSDIAEQVTRRLRFSGDL